MTTLTASLRTTSGPALLRAALGLDAIVTAASAVAYLAGFALLDSALGVPQALLLGVGAFLLVYAAFVARLATADRPNRAAVAGVIAANVVWAIDSVILLAVDGFSPTLAGQIVVAVQAAGVAGLAALQYAGLRRA
jgi:hypothetical protein